MAYSKALADQVRSSVLQHGWRSVKEREENGNLSFILKNEPLTRIEGEDLFIRCFPEDTDIYLQEPGIYRYEVDDNIDVKGWLRLIPEVSHSRDELDKWLQVSYNYVSTEV